jgi:hypothetical protein
MSTQSILLDVTMVRKTMPKSVSGFPIPHFDKKMDFLLKRPGYYIFPEDKKTGKMTIICSPKALMAALSVDLSQYGRWREANRIPKINNAMKLAQIFSIQPAWLNESSYEHFVELCNGASVQPTWSTLLAWAQDDDVGSITQIEPPPSPRALHMRPKAQAKQLQTVDRGSTVSVSFRLTAAWAGWNAVLLSEDPSGFLCLVPRFVGEPEFPASLMKLPPKASYDLRGLPTDIDVTGRCSLILVATEKPLPPDLNKLLREDREGKTLEPTLDRLAAHLMPLCAMPDAAVPATGGPSAVILRLRYSVV